MDNGNRLRCRKPKLAAPDSRAILLGSPSPSSPPPNQDEVDGCGLELKNNSNSQTPRLGCTMKSASTRFLLTSIANRPIQTPIPNANGRHASHLIYPPGLLPDRLGGLRPPRKRIFRVKSLTWALTWNDTSNSASKRVSFTPTSYTYTEKTHRPNTQKAVGANYHGSDLNDLYEFCGTGIRSERLWKSNRQLRKFSNANTGGHHTAPFDGL
ncbi:hypothetical protein EDC01DRAFT_632264 [Geopyxis carbonaria]|nr:hypothetical protein EDC01DRAFT_632264 [Geopyxis carbonaria]